ncbi:MAG: DNA mismatch repair endonuclease MutL [Clostridiales bacterium]|nr:DNA mismatch repair endonuclease MutL [Clostridiales bacterium]
MAINVLDTMIINRISAGEVVESPFSIVKELLDNSIDAGATKIDISIRGGGSDHISVKDNGSGIEYEDIKKAFLPHATSKIKDIEDLESILTLGFRGEALASISNVSQVTLTTKTETNDCAYSINVFGGEFGEIVPTSFERGTEIQVNNLFYNTPARRKFLKKPKSEENQITNIITRYMLAHPEISFKYTVDDKVLYQTKGTNLKDAIYSIYGLEFTQNLLEIEGEIGNVHLSGFVSKVGFSKPNTTYQTLMVNSRYVIDEIVSKAVYMAQEEYLMPRQFPVYIMNITMPSIDVDVNVHPSKMNIKFANPSKIYDLVYSTVKSAIFKFLNPEIKKVEAKEEVIESNLIKTDLSSLQEFSISPNLTTTYNDKIRFHQSSQVEMEEVEADIKEETKEIKPLVQEKVEEVKQFENYQNIRDLTSYKIVGEIFNEFVILENEDNMILLDFHAGHERLNYDKLVAMIESKQLVTQDLLVPYVQEISEQELSYILSLKDELFALGFDVDSFGERAIVINSVPVQLKDINLKNFVDDLLHDMKNIKPKINNELNNYLMQKACKSSVKSGMKLSEMEIKDLLKDLDMKHPVLLCPHGRPVLTVVSRSQIEKWFKRIV